MNQQFEIEGTIEFDPTNETNKHEKQASWKKTVFINLGGDIHIYYQWLLKRRFGLMLNKPLRQPHVTIISDRVYDLELYKQAKEHFNGKKISIFYRNDEIRSAVTKKSFFIKDQEIKSNVQHWWLRAECPQAESIRILMGLDPIPYNKFHISIGYVNEYEDKTKMDVKNINFIHSEYILRQILKFDL